MAAGVGGKNEDEDEDEDDGGGDGVHGDLDPVGGGDPQGFGADGFETGIGQQHQERRPTAAPTPDRGGMAEATPCR